METIKKWFKNPNLFGYPTIDICEPWNNNHNINSGNKKNNKQGYVTANDIWLWLEHARSKISSKNRFEFDSVIFYASCHGDKTCGLFVAYNFCLKNMFVCFFLLCKY